MSTQRMSTKRSRKLARTIVITSLLVVIGAGFSAVGNASTPATSANNSVASSYMKIVVAPGETLWSIAGMVGGNSSATVDAIIEANHLTSSEVQAGQKLLVPIK